MASAAGITWVAIAFLGLVDIARPSVPVIAVLGAAAAGLVSGALFALWLDRRLVGHLRSLAHGLRSARIHELRDLPASAGWGELSDATHAAHERLVAARQLELTAAELAAARAQLDTLRAAVERWAESERWEPLHLGDGPLTEFGLSLDRGLQRMAEVREQDEEVARRLGGEFDVARADARESVEQAERGFVEATALLTTVRELQRLSADLHVALAPVEGEAPASASAAAFGRWRAAATEGLESLIAASAESVDHLGAGLLRVHEVADQVRRLSNRTTLVALNVAIARAHDEGAGEAGDLAEELKRLARDVRDANERTETLSRDIDAEVAAAVHRMGEVRARVVESLAALPPPPVEPERPAQDTLRIMERVREMVQDATRKGERLSAAGERASRAAQRLVRRLEEQAREIEGFATRLAGPEPALPEEPRAVDPGAEPVAPRTPADIRRLQLLETVGEEPSDGGPDAAEDRS